MVFFQTRFLVASGLRDVSGNLVFHGIVLFRDSSIHLALITELLKSFPPKNFTYTALGIEPLKNYHFLYDIILASLIKITGLNINFVYFQLAPVIISFLLCLTIYITTLKLSKNRWAAALSIFFVVFGTGVSQIPNQFMADQILSNLVNPHGGLSLALFLTLFLLLFSYEKGNKKALIFYAPLLALSFSLKAYGGIVFAGGAVVAALGFYILKKDRLMPLVTLCSLFGMAALIFLTIDNKAAGLSFAPLWTLNHLAADSDKLNNPSFLTGSIVKLIPAYFLVFAVYLCGNLGIRILGFFAIFEKIKKPSKISPAFLFLLSVALASLTIPLVFNQGKKAYDIIQFTSYFLLFMGIMFSVALFDLLPKLKFKFLQILIVVLTILFLVFMNWPKMTGSVEKVVISKNLVTAGDFIQKNSEPYAIFLLAPTDFNLESNWFNYLSARRTVYSGWRMADQIGVPKDSGVKLITTVFDCKNKEVKFDLVFLEDKDRQMFDRINRCYKFTEWYNKDKVLILKRKS